MRLCLETKMYLLDHVDTNHICKTKLSLRFLKTLRFICYECKFDFKITMVGRTVYELSKMTIKTSRLYKYNFVLLDFITI